MAMTSSDWRAVVDGDLQGIMESDGERLYWAFPDIDSEDSMPIIDPGSPRRAFFLADKVRWIMTFETFHDLMRSASNGSVADDMVQYPHCNDRVTVVDRPCKKNAGKP